MNVTVNQTANWSLQPGINTPKGTNIGTLTATPGSTTAMYQACQPSATVVCRPNQQVTIVATSTADTTTTAAITVLVEAPPQITSLSPVTDPVTVGCPPPGTVLTGTISSTNPGSIGGSYLSNNQNIPFAAGISGVGTLFFDLSATGGVIPYTWSVSAGTLPAGLSIGTNPQNGKMSITGVPVSAGCANITLQVADAAGVTSTTPFSVLVIPQPLSVQHPPLPTAYVGTPYAPTALKVSGGTPPYTWIADPNTVAVFPPGLSASSPAQNPDIAVISGTPTSAGLIEQTNTPALFVHDSQLPYPAAAHDTSITLGGGQVLNPDSSCHTGLESNLNTAPGPYAFLLRGFDSHGPVVIAGNFTVDGTGNVTGGVEDINRSTGPATNLAVSGGSYTLGPNGSANASSPNRGCLTLTSSAGTMTFRTAFGTCSTTATTGVAGGCQNNGHFTRGRILVDDSTTGIRATGIIRQQQSSATLSGLYAFGFSGWDAASGRYAIAGSADASSGSFNAVAADFNDAGTVGSNLTGGSGTYTTTASSRGTATISVGSASFGMAVYVVSSGEAILATTDALDPSHPMLSGEALSATGPFSLAALQNTYMVRMAGLSSGASDPSIGLLTFDGLGTLAGTLFENNGGTLGTTAISANYAIDGTTGRLAISAPLQSQNLGPHPFAAYVAAAANGVSAFLVSTGTDASAQSGILQFQIQNPPPRNFSNASLVGASFIGTDEDLDANTTNYVGMTAPNGIGGFSGAGLFYDASYPAAAGPFPGPQGLVPNDQFSASYSIGKNGVGTFGGQTVSVTDGATIFVMDESPLATSPAITVVEQ